MLRSPIKTPSIVIDGAVDKLTLVLVTGGLTAVDVQDFAGDEVGVVQIHNRLSDVADFAHVADRVQIAQRFMGFFAVLAIAALILL